MLVDVYVCVGVYVVRYCIFTCTICVNMDIDVYALVENNEDVGVRLDVDVKVVGASCRYTCALFCSGTGV